jgi:hypothetical protein
MQAALSNIVVDFHNSSTTSLQVSVSPSTVHANDISSQAPKHITSIFNGERLVVYSFSGKLILY